MKKIALLMVLCLAVVPTAFAVDDSLLLTGSVGADIGVRHIQNSDDGDSGSYLAYGANGKFSFPVWRGFSLQLDADYEKYNVPEYNVEMQKSVTLHASYRNPDQYLVGMFGGYAKGKADNEDAVSGDFYGIEAQYHLNRVTLYGQIATAEVDNYDDSDNIFEGKYYTVAARYFPSDDVMLQIAYELGESPDDFEDDGDRGRITSFSASGEMKLLEALPIYGAVTLAVNDIQANDEDDGDETVLMFGVKYYFGAQSLFANNRRGATLDSSLLPSRAAAWASTLD